MSEKSKGINLFWTLMAIVAVGAVALGGYVAWKLVYSTTPKIERANMDPEQMLERTVEARQQENQSGTEPIRILVPVPSNSMGNTREDEFSYEDDEILEDEDFDEEEESESADESASEQADNQSSYTYTLDEISTSKKPATSATKAKPVVPQKPKLREASYVAGLQACMKETLFPCSWKDSSNRTVIKRYWLRGKNGPVERIMFTPAGKIISQTFSTVNGTVTRYVGNFAELYFEKGLLTKIRTFPYEDPNLRDWFLIGKDGKISACLCGIPTKDCCARSLLYHEGDSRRYCSLFPLDTDFCAKSRG